MNKKIKFSIIIPNYNKGKYVSQCLESIYGQTYKNFEVIVIDDGSTDNSIEELKKFPIDKFLTTNRKHAGGASNVGLSVAQGEYIAFLDSDDYLLNNNVLMELSDLIKDEDIIFLNYTRDKNGIFKDYIEDEVSLEEKIKTTNLGCPTKCFKKNLLSGINFPEEKRFEDIIFTLEALCKAETCTYYNNSFFTYRFVENSNLTSVMDEITIFHLLEEQTKIFQLYFKYPKYQESLMYRIKEAKIPLKIEVLTNILDTGKNNYNEYFN